VSASIEKASPRPHWIRREDLPPVLALLTLGAVVRVSFLLLSATPSFDPWRHLLLVQHIRDGIGFTLFEGQPYIWYSPVWYYLCAGLPTWFAMDRAAALLSLLCAPLIYLLLRGDQREPSRRVAFSGGLLMALSGPLVAFTCHYGPEAFALALTLLALLLVARGRGVWTSLLAGAAFGIAVAARLNFAPNLLLFVPLLRRPPRALAFLSGTALPLLLTWWRNHSVIAAHRWVFTWDGLATPSSDFGPLSTLVIQMHPAVREGLHRLHELVVPWPEWVWSGGRPAWGSMLFVLAALLCLFYSRRTWPILVAVLSLVYFLVLDRSMSSNFFRIYLSLFPVFFLGAAWAAARLWRAERSVLRRLAWAPAALLLLAGAGYLRPKTGLTLDLANPPPGLLAEQAYMVNSGFYHPESVIFLHPDKRFIGMPLHPEQFPEFADAHPAFRHVLWHPFSVQDELADYLRESADWQVTETASNRHGRRYVVLSRADE
jgi:hypothetical protein